MKRFKQLLTFNLLFQKLCFLISIQITIHSRQNKDNVLAVKAMTSMAEFLYFFRCKHDVQTRIASTCNTTTTNDDDIDELLLRLSPLLSCTTVYLREKIYINSIPYITINTKRWDVHTYMACLVMQLSKRRNL